jgi:hypothetical protein
MASTTMKILTSILAIGLIVALIVAFYPKGNGEPTSGPYLHKIYSATSADGIHWTVNNTLLVNHASVPGAVYYNGKIYLYFVNGAGAERLSVAISTDQGKSFTVHDVAITGSNSPRPVDPSAVVDGGKIRLTYLGNLDQEGVPPKIMTATTTDGISFTEEAIIFSGNQITDPDLFHYGESEWVLFVNRGNTLIRANSSTATGPFIQDTSFNFSGGWLCSTHFINGKYYTYHHDGTGINVAEYKNSSLTLLATNLITGFTGIVGDPTVVDLGANNLIMYFKVCQSC